MAGQTTMRSSTLAGALAIAAACSGLIWIDDEGCERPVAVEPTPGTEQAQREGVARWTFAVDPKPLGAHVTRGLDWLVAHQLENGGWGQGEESANMGDALNGLTAKSDVADTCMATLALVRAGATPGVGPRGTALLRGVAHVCGEIEESDQESLYITEVRGTRVQMKIGTYVDTFLASMLLSEVKDRMGTKQDDTRVERALAKVLAKIEANQREDGGFEGSGWAPVLAQSMAGKGINRAYQAGAGGDFGVALENFGYFDGLTEAPAGESLSAADGPGLGRRYAGGTGGAGSAGVLLYSLAANLGGLQEFVNSSRQREQELDLLLETETDAVTIAKVEKEKRTLEKARDVQLETQGAVVQRLDDPSFVAGFGSNGGEEFLSYMNISESLVVQGGEAWTKWDASMSANLARVQNHDGCWSGHHCITGRTFVTSAALLTLMADRTPVPVESIGDASAPAAPAKAEPTESIGVIEVTEVTEVNEVEREGDEE